MHAADKAIADTIGKLNMEALEALASKDAVTQESDFGFSKGRGTEVSVESGDHIVTLRLSVEAMVKRPVTDE